MQHESLLNLLSKSLIIVTLLLITSCSLNPPDTFVCAELNQTKGYCSKTLSDEEKIVEGQAWLDIKKHSLVMPNDSYAEIKAFLLKACKATNKCNVEETEQRLELLEKRATYFKQLNDE